MTEQTAASPQGGSPIEPEEPTRQSLAGRFRNYFLTGLIVAGPVAITIYLTWSFVTWVDDLVRPLVPVAYRPETYLPYKVPGSGLIVAIFALTLLGFLTANLIGRTLVDLGETVLDRMPIVRAIYRSLKQVFETLFSGKGSSFRKVGLVEFPAPGMWSIVLISQSPSPNVSAKLPSQEHLSVFLPCAPNPTTGFFFYVPKSAVVEIDMTAEQAATLIMSAGVVQPGSDPKKNVVALGEMAQAARLASQNAALTNGADATREESASGTR